MARLTLTLLLVPCVLLTQLPAVPHTHGPGSHEGPAHSSQPHFHFILFSPVGAARGPGAPRSCTAPGCSASVALTAEATEGDAPADHDRDAVYVDVGVASPDRFEHDRVGANLGVTPFAHWLPLDFLACLASRPAPDPGPRGATITCPLYVRFLALII